MTSPRTASTSRRTTCGASASATRSSTQGIATSEFRALLAHEVAYARSLFEQGLPLIGKVGRDLAVDLDLFSRGGLEILRAIEKRDYDVLSARPSISKSTKLALALRAVSGKVLPFLHLGARSGKAACTQSLDSAYAVCRAIAKREAKNFYYAFVALPPARRNAICAIYAFMRKADDLADDESIAPADRRMHLDTWLASWHLAAQGADTDDPVFLAVRDATDRFAIPLTLLDELVAGTTMDLDRAVSGAPDTYATFDELYRYCYLVASVVGLVCIRIFGYTNRAAEKLAEETGIAFQLTNILRDVAEDAERNRVYLPLETLAAHSITLDALIHRMPSTPPSESERAVLAELAARAEHYYQSAEALLPLIDRESRPALRVLVTIYHDLLKRIESADYDVFTHRASVPTAKKLSILTAGLARITATRLFG